MFLTVHPHGRGDRWGSCRVWGSWLGSPPRAWGQDGNRRKIRRSGRFTPTGVGTGSQQLSCLLMLPVHPHGRGDRQGRLIDGRRVIGSPPRAWGQGTQHLDFARVARFTPTGVGTGTYTRSAGWAWTVHPHGRGDRRHCLSPLVPVVGSPPRAWGQVLFTPSSKLPSRFTPTGVGTGACASRGWTPTPVHPHGRGDRRRRHVHARRAAGSPPRAWGQGDHLGDLPADLRFTPTGVGTGAASQKPISASSVHPHGRGDRSKKRRQKSRFWAKRFRLGSALLRAPGVGRGRPPSRARFLRSRRESVLSGYGLADRTPARCSWTRSA